MDEQQAREIIKASLIENKIDIGDPFKFKDLLGSPMVQEMMHKYVEAGYFTKEDLLLTKEGKEHFGI